MMHAPKLSFANTIAAASALAAVIVSSSAANAFADDTSLRVLDATIGALGAGYRAAPALMLGLALAIGLPLLTIITRIVPRLVPAFDETHGSRPDPDDAVETHISNASSRRGSHPFVEIEGATRSARCAIPGDMLRIGREDDNDIRIPSRAVHRYHAAIHREDYDDWHITDLSGIEGNGLIVNGRRCGEARLNDGDVIQLGPGRLRFRAGVA